MRPTSNNNNSNNNNNNNNNRRSRRGIGRRSNVPLRHQMFDSNGPDIRIRGNAYQVHEKYLQLARDAFASGDRITAENLYQHAEHYFRIILQINEQSQTDPRQRSQPGYGGNGPLGNGNSAQDGSDGDDEYEEEMSHRQPM